MNRNNNRKRQASNNGYHSQKKSKHQRTVQVQEEKQKQQVERQKQNEEDQHHQRLQDMAWRQRYDSDLEEYLKDYEYLNEYYEEMEPIEQKQVKELEDMERLEIQQLDDDYKEQLKQIELAEHEDEQQQKQRDIEMQHQLKQLEQQEHIKQFQQECYYEWLEHFQQHKKKILPTKTFDLMETILKPFPYTDTYGIIEPSDNNNDQSDSSIMIKAKNEVEEQQQQYRQQHQQQQQKKMNIPLMFEDKLFKMIEEYGPSLDVIIQVIDDEFNEDDWLLMDNETIRQQQQIDHMNVYHIHSTLFRRKKRPVLHIDHCNINSIRYQLKERHYLLLKVYKSNHFYLCHTNEMKQKVTDYMTRSDAYIIIQDLHQIHNNYIEHLLKTIVTEITKTLDELLNRQCISEIQLQQMKMDPSRLRLDFLSFQPDPRYNDVPFRAHMTCCLGPTMTLSRFLYRLLQPLYEQVTKSITFLEGVDGIDAVELYAKNGYLRHTTLFTAFSIDNLSTVFAHEHSIRSLERFLNEYASNRQIQEITIEAIIELVTIFLQNQYFIYDNKVHRQIKGSGSGSYLSKILANIDMFYRQQNLVNTLFEKKEIFGRCFDEAFLTWNGSKDDLYNLLKKMATDQHPQLRIRYSIEEKVNYLEATIAHQYGRVDNNVNHDTLMDPYSLIPLSSYPLHTIISTVRVALLRAITYCSTRESFKKEIDYIESMLTRHELSITSIISKMEYKVRLLYYDTQRYADTNQYAQDRHFARSIQKEEIMAKIKQQQYQLAEEGLFYLTCPLHGQQLIQFKQDFEYLLERCYGKDFNLKKLNIDIVARPNYPANTR